MWFGMDQSQWRVSIFFAICSKEKGDAEVEAECSEMSVSSFWELT